MPIADDDMFLIQTAAGTSQKIQASNMKGGLSSTFANDFFLVNTGTNGATPSYKVRGSNMNSRIGDGGDYWLLLNRGTTPYKVNQTTFNSYFDTGGTINWIGVYETTMTTANTNVAMPSWAATADLIIAVVWLDLSSAGNFTPLNGFQLVTRGPSNSRPTAEVLLYDGSLTGTVNICSTTAAAKNVLLYGFNYTGEYSVISTDSIEETSPFTWTGIAPTQTEMTAAAVDEYYALFFDSARPTAGTVVNPGTNRPTNGVDAITYNSGSGSNAVSYRTTNVYTDGTVPPASYSWDLEHSNRGVAFAVFLGARSAGTPGFGEQAYITPGTYSWTAPAGVTSVNVVCIGGGANKTSNTHSGGGGGLGWKNNISVTPGNSYTVVVGNAEQDSYFIDATTVKGGGSTNRVGGTYVGDGGGNGGNGWNNGADPGGGGAGGYSGDGGDGGEGVSSTSGQNGTAGQGGGGGGGAGWWSGAGGGVGIYGEGTNGARGAGSSSAANNGGGGGSGGQRGCPYSANNATGDQSTTGGGLYGGGAGSGPDAVFGGSGAVRIMWGTGRAFPSTMAGQI